MGIYLAAACDPCCSRDRSRWSRERRHHHGFFSFKCCAWTHHFTSVLGCKRQRALVLSSVCVFICLRLGGLAAVYSAGLVTKEQLKVLRLQDHCITWRPVPLLCRNMQVSWFSSTPLAANPLRSDDNITLAHTASSSAEPLRQSECSRDG